MKIEILKDGLKNGDNMKILKKGDVIDVSKERAEKAIKLGRAEKYNPNKKTETEETETEEKKSQQEKTSDKLEKK